jgi:hypothetical protein
MIEIYKLKDINSGEILKNFRFDETDTRIHKSRRKIKITTRFDTTVLNLYQILKTVHIEFTFPI